ncbi:MAG: DUF4388 domain-containing protein [Acidobacteriota bacterium]
MLQGNLATLSLPGLIQLLHLERRTGRLDLTPEAEVGPGGKVWFEDGSAIHAELGDGGEGETALRALLSLEKGEFAFLTGEESPSRSIELPTEQLVMEAACQRDHERREGSVRPSDVPRFAPVGDGEHTPRFNTLQWRVLAAIDGRRDVAALSAELGLSPAGLGDLLQELVKAGAVDLTPGHAE